MTRANGYTSALALDPNRLHARAARGMLLVARRPRHRSGAGSAPGVRRQRQGSRGAQRAGVCVDADRAIRRGGGCAEARDGAASGEREHRAQPGAAARHIARQPRPRRRDTRCVWRSTFESGQAVEIRVRSTRWRRHMPRPVVSTWRAKRRTRPPRSRGSSATSRRRTKSLPTRGATGRSSPRLQNEFTSAVLRLVKNPLRE